MYFHSDCFVETTGDRFQKQGDLGCLTIPFKWGSSVGYETRRNGGESLDAQNRATQRGSLPRAGELRL